MCYELKVVGTIRNGVYVLSSEFTVVTIISSACLPSPTSKLYIIIKVVSRCCHCTVDENSYSDKVYKRVDAATKRTKVVKWNV